MATKKELQEEAKARGIAVSSDATKEELEAALSPSGLGTTDVAIDGHHPESVIEDVPDDEKPHPTSVMQREVRPDERGDAARGKTALAAPPEE